MNLQYWLFVTFTVILLTSDSFAYKVGTKYLYNYRVNTLQSLSSRNGASTWSRLNLEVIPLTSPSNQLSLKFKISSITNALGPLVEPTENTDPNYGLTSEFVATYDEPSIKLKVNPTDGKSTIGLKKSIASLFYVQRSNERSFSSFEETPIGKCNTIYNVCKTGHNVTKVRDYGNCTEEIDMLGKRFMSPEFHKCTRNPEYTIPWVSRTVTFTYSMDDKVIKSCESLETVSFTLFGHKSSSCIEIKGTLGLESSTSMVTPATEPTGLTDISVSGKPSPVKGKEDFDSTSVNLTEPSKYAMWPKQEVADIIKALEMLSSSINAGMSSPLLTNDNFTMDFLELQLSMSRLSLTELQSIYSTIKSRTDSVPKLFLDTLRYTPSNPVFSFMKTFIKSTSDKEKLALRGYLQIIPFRELKVTKQLLESYLELCKQSVGSGLEETCFYSFSNILQVHCNDNRGKMAESSCTSKISTLYYNKMITTLREIVPESHYRDILENGLSNNVYNEESLKLLLKRITDPRQKVRRTATVALFGHRLDMNNNVPLSSIQNILYGKVMNRTEDHVVRIYSFLVYMKTGPSLSQFRSLVRYIADPDEDEQVAHYTLSLLKAMKHSVNPCYSGLTLLSKYGIREMKSLKGRFAHTSLALSTARIFESYDKDFGFGGSTVLSYIMNKETLSANVYLEEKMVVNGYTGGHLAVLFESFPNILTSGFKDVSTEGLEKTAKAITLTMQSIYSSGRSPLRVADTDTRISFMINGRIVDSLDYFTLLRLFQVDGFNSLSKMMIGQQFYNYIPSEHGFSLFNIMVSGSGLFARMGSIDVTSKPASDVIFQSALAPTLRRDVGAYTLTGLKSPFGSGRAGIMTSIQRTHRLPLNLTYIVTKKTAQIKFKMPTEPTDLMWYRMNAFTFNEKSSIGSIRSSLKPLFVDYNGKPENDLTSGKTIWKGFMGNGLRMVTTINRPRPMDELGYRYRLMEKSLYNDDVRLLRMKFEYGGLIVPIDWKLTLLPDPKHSELTFAFNRSISVTDDSHTGEGQLTVFKNAEQIISTRLSYSYTNDFLNHYLRLYYNNYLRNIHTCVKGDLFSPKVNYSRYTSLEGLTGSEDKLHFNGSIYFDQSCSKKDIIIKGEFSPSEDQKDSRYTQLYSSSCGKYGLMTNKIPYCSGYHYHLGELRSVKVHVTHKDVPSYFWRYLTYIHNRGIKMYANQVRYYGSNEVTDPSVTLVSANSTWFSPYKYNVSYKMTGREEFWNNIPSVGLSWPNSYSLFDYHLYESFHRIVRLPYCYVQKSRLRTFDERPSNVTIKPGCLKTLLMDCDRGKFIVTFSQDSDGKLETIEVYNESPATKLEVSVKSNTMKLNNSPVDPTVKSKVVTIKDFGIYKRITLTTENIKIFYDDVGIYVKAPKVDYARLCGLCGNMNGCHHDDDYPLPVSSSSSHHHHSKNLWLTKDDRNTAKGCIQN